MEELDIKPVKYRIGKMKKLPHQMSDLELENWQKKGDEEIKTYLFSINQPMVYFVDGTPVVEYKNGIIEKLG